GVRPALVPARVVFASAGRQERGQLAVGYLVNIIFAVVPIVGHNISRAADGLREPVQGVQGGLELPGVIRGLAEMASHNQVAIHINRRLGVVGLLPPILAGGHDPGFRVGKIHLVFVSGARLRRFWGAAGDLFAGALLFFGPLGHPLFVFSLFLLVTLFGTFFDHGLRLLYS